MTKPEDLGFGPRREVRDFDGSVFVGKTATIRLGTGGRVARNRQWDWS